MRRLLTLMLALWICAACSAKSPVPTSLPMDLQTMVDESSQELAAGPLPGLPDDAEPLDPELTEDPEDLAEAGEAITAEVPSAEEAAESAPEISIEIPAEAYASSAYKRYYTLYTATGKDGKPLKGRRAFERWLERSGQFLPYVKQVLKERGLPKELAYLPFAESGYNPWAYSRAGAAGAWQFMPFTGRKFGMTVDWWLDERRDLYRSTHAAADYLESLHAMFGDWHLALAAYNCGEGRLSRAMRRYGCETFFELAALNRRQRGRLSLETRNYVPKFLAIVTIMNNLEALGFTPPHEPAADELPVPMAVKGGTDLAALAKHVGLSWKDFSHLNPAFRRTVSHPQREYTVYLPPVNLAAGQEFLASPDARPYAGWKQYRVRSGDSLWKISRRYGVPVAVLKQTNDLRRNLLRPGQRLLIPGHAVARRSAPSPAVRTAPAARAPRADDTTYRVRRGDTLYDLSRRYGVTVAALRKANHMGSGSHLAIGQKLTIPANASASMAQAPAPTKGTPITHKVRRGETPWDIAQRYKVSVKHLLAWNNLNSRSTIFPGDTLKVYPH